MLMNFRSAVLCVSVMQANSFGEKIKKKSISLENVA